VTPNREQPRNTRRRGVGGRQVDEETTSIILAMFAIICLQFNPTGLS
jgi:hypothetical protein